MAPIEMEGDMMPVLRVNDGTFADLSTLKTWFGTRTPSETIDHLVRQAMEQLGIERDGQIEEVSTTGTNVMEFHTAPGLSFTKPLSASINGKSLPNPRWSAILLTMIAQVKAKGLEGDKLVRELNVPSKAERYEDEGFKYHADLGVSVQGQSASDAWKEVDRTRKEVAYSRLRRVLVAAEPQSAASRSNRRAPLWKCLTQQPCLRARCPQRAGAVSSLVPRPLLPFSTSATSNFFISIIASKARFASAPPAAIGQGAQGSLPARLTPLRRAAMRGPGRARAQYQGGPSSLHPYVRRPVRHWLGEWSKFDPP